MTAKIEIDQIFFHILRRNKVAKIEGTRDELRRMRAAIEAKRGLAKRAAIEIQRRNGALYVWAERQGA